MSSKLSCLFGALCIALLVPISARSQDEQSSRIEQMCKEGEALLQKGDIVGAYELYVQCTNIDWTGNNLALNDKNLLFTSQLYHGNGDLDRAEEFIQRAIKFTEIRSSTKFIGSALAVRYEEAADIRLDMGDYDKAIELAKEGMSHAVSEQNANILGRLKTIMGEAYFAKGNLESAKQILIEAEYHFVTDSSYYHLTPKLKLNAMKNGNKIFLPSTYRELARISVADGDTASAVRYYKAMYECADHYDSANMLGAATGLAELLPEGDADKARYASIADSLSYVPALKKFEDQLTLSTIEFPLREKEYQLRIERERLWYTIGVCLLMILLAAQGFMSARRHKKARKIAEDQAAALVKANLQKDKLLAIAEAEVKDIAIREELDEIASDPLILPDIKLTGRELEVARMTAKGMLKKEIAEALHISEATVGVHKTHIYRKLGINNNIELLRYLQKTKKDS